MQSAHAVALAGGVCLLVATVVLLPPSSQAEWAVHAPTIGLDVPTMTLPSKHQRMRSRLPLREEVAVGVAPATTPEVAPATTPEVGLEAATGAEPWAWPRWPHALGLTAAVAALLATFSVSRHRLARSAAAAPFVQQAEDAPWCVVPLTGEAFDPLGLNEDGEPAGRSFKTRYGQVLLFACVATFSAFPASAADLDVFAGLDESQKTFVNFLIFGQAVGFLGLLATANVVRQQKEELDVLEDTLEKVYRQLRQRARARQGELLAQVPPVLLSPVLDQDDHEEELQRAVVQLLRHGRHALKEQRGAEALREFQAAEQLLRGGGHLEDRLRFERKAERGVAAALQQLGRTEEALASLQRVLDMTKTIGDSTGLEEVYGAMADLLAELGRYVEAGKYYDLHSNRVVEDSVTGVEGAL